MVSDKKFKEFKEVQPPALDESWWQSLMAEEYRERGAEVDDILPEWEQASEREAVGEEDLGNIDWNYAYDMYQADIALQMQVVGFNKGGLLVDGKKLQGFVPISHLIGLPADMRDDSPEQMLEEYVNNQLRLKIIECDKNRGRVVFSERAAQVESGARNQIFTQLEPGQCVDGTVTNITEFGAFVDLGGVEGLVHVSEISWGRIRHPSDAVSVGEVVKVYVIQVDPSRSRIALSLKRLCDNPWETVDERYHVGQVAHAKITSIVPYGAFARLEEGLDGLIHISELPKEDENVDSLEMLYEGQEVDVRVVNVDASKQRLGLSLQLSA